MKFSKLISPLSVEDFRKRFEKGACFVIRGDESRIEGLISLDDIEKRLNDGCNLNQPVQMIRDGKRQALMDENVAWSKVAVKKHEVLAQIHSNCSFMMPNSSQINPRVAELIDGIEEAFDDQNMTADLHLYVSSGVASTAYNAHRDFPQHKIYLQVIGNTQWTIYSHSPDLPNHVMAATEKEVSDGMLEVVSQFTLTPGDLFYMPPAVFHRISNDAGPRVSFSIPFTSSPKTNPMDRTYIPFRSIFESHMKPA